jgi:hypothetical protein
LTGNLDWSVQVRQKEADPVQRVQAWPQGRQKLVIEDLSKPL